MAFFSARANNVKEDQRKRPVGREADLFAPDLTYLAEQRERVEAAYSEAKSRQTWREHDYIDPEYLEQDAKAAAFSDLDRTDFADIDSGSTRLERRGEARAASYLKRRAQQREAKRRKRRLRQSPMPIERGDLCAMYLAAARVFVPVLLLAALIIILFAWLYAH